MEIAEHNENIYNIYERMGIAPEMFISIFICFLFVVHALAKCSQICCGCDLMVHHRGERRDISRESCVSLCVSSARGRELSENGFASMNDCHVHTRAYSAGENCKTTRYLIFIQFESRRRNGIEEYTHEITLIKAAHFFFRVGADATRKLVIYCIFLLPPPPPSPPIYWVRA